MERRWVSVREASAYFDLPPATLYSLIGRRRLPVGAVLRLGRALRINVSVLEAQAGIGTGKHAK
jgi:hypothetical protein